MDHTGAEATAAGKADLAALAAAFGELLHHAGVPVTPEQSGRFVRAITLSRPHYVDDLYWAGRVTLLTDREQAGAYDRVFGQVFRGWVDIADSRGDTNSPPVSVRPRQPSEAPPAGRKGATASMPDSTSFSSAGPASSGGVDREATAALASPAERLATTNFAELEATELQQLALLMRTLKMTPALRPGRRSRRHPAGDRLDLRATLRASHRHGGDPAKLVHRRRRLKPRRVIVLCDISGSMAPYARAYIQFLHAAAGGSRAEVFSFATRLTRLTREMRGARPQLAIDRAVASAADWKGGTRIGHAVGSFLDNYGRRGMAHGAVVVIVSDGWEGADPQMLGEQMERLSRLAHRIVWVNPRTADSRYQPLAGGMRAALPHCDAVVSGHSFSALSQVVAAIAGGLAQGTSGRADQPLRAALANED
jgi:uncharacterized protein with von Willebrand factor type A (vWA) domain